jgi:hypothetical protein
MKADDLPIPRDENGDWDWRNDPHRNPRLIRQRKVLLPEEIAELSGEERLRAENEYADRHEFSSRD